MKHPPKSCFTLAIAVLLTLLSVVPSLAESKQRPGKEAGGSAAGHAKYREGMILVKPKKGVDQEKMSNLHAANGAKTEKTFKTINWQLVRLRNGDTVENAIERYMKSGIVENAEPNYLFYPMQVPTHPNDPYYQSGQLWGLGKISAPLAWTDQFWADDVLVLVADTGCNWYHPDLAPNIWVNPGEDLNQNGSYEDWWHTYEVDGVYGDLNGDDDDDNGWPDDVVGINTVVAEGGVYWSPFDGQGHGTSMAGIIGAVGNNAIGTVGVNWYAKLAIAKFIGIDDGADTARCLECFEYGHAIGAKIINCSFGGGADPAPIREIIERYRDPDLDGDLSDGIIFVCAAGNGVAVGYGVSAQSDNDEYPQYPASYEFDNVVAVAGTDQNDLLMNHIYEIVSNYGRTSVDLAAPGKDIWSTSYSPPYAEGDGTSASAAFVSGALAMLKSRYPNDQYPKLIARLFEGVDDLPSLEDKCVTEGRLNLYNSITLDVPDLYVTPDKAFNSKGGEGGPFVPASKQYRLANYSDVSLAWHATSDQNWVAISPTSGTLESYEEIMVTVSFNSAAGSLGIGSHSATLSLVNDTSGSGNTTRAVNLAIAPIYVTENGDDANDGLSWATAKRTIQKGVDTARDAGMNEVWVAQGRYARFGMWEEHNGIKVYGGFVGNETSRSARPAFPRANANTTASIVDGSLQSGIPIAVSDCANPTTRIDGFTVVNSSSYSIYSSSSSPTIVNNTVYGGYFSYQGTAIYLTGGSPVLVNNKVRGCFGDQGAGIYCGNTVAGTLIANNSVLGNLSTSTYYGCAGMYLNYATALVANNTIVGNKATNVSSGEPTTTAGGVWVSSGNITFVNNVVAFNSSGIHLTNGTNIVMRNCDVYGNDAYNCRRENDPSWNPIGSNGNISADPVFAAYTYGNVHIQPASPCRNTGDNNVVASDWKDIDGQARVQPVGGTVDMGADESPGSTQPAGSPAVIRVSPTGNDANSGSSWTLAKLTIQAAINAAAGTGGEVWVKTGTYRENIALSPYVYVYGGFSGSESIRAQRNWATYPVSIDGQGNGAVVKAGPGSNWCTLNGFILRNGSGYKASASQTESYGGGIYCANSFPEFANNTILGNRADYGGGIYCDNALPTIVNNKIAANLSEYGGGLYVMSGSGVIANNTVVSNTAEYNDGYNIAGGGLDLTGADQDMVVTNNIVAFNSSGIYVNMWGYEYIDFRNNCVYGNTDYQYYDPYTDPPTSWQPPVEGNNISVDPKLVSLTYGNLHIHWDSPCKNTGDNSVVKSDWKDIDNQARILPTTGGVVDIGCDEANQVWNDWTPARYYVATTGNDANNGTGWGPTTAKATVQAGIDQATINGGEVWVKAGTYNERITLHPYAYVYGGFAGMECFLYDRKCQLNPCILNGQALGSVVTARTGIGLSRLDGFTITNGLGTVDSSGYKCGGGIYCKYAAPTFANNIITANTADHGAGIACIASSPVINANKITGNNTGNYNQGGGIYCSDYAEPIISNNIITANNAPYGSGAGIALLASASPLIVNNTIVGNSTNHNGYTAGTGGGIYCNTGYYNDPAVVKNNIIADNSRFGVARLDGTLTLGNNNVYNNADGNYYNISAGSGDISQDPDFIDAIAGDYRLLYGSPCIDAGNNTGAPATDFNGNLRPYDSDANGSTVCDMGAYELGVWPAKYRAHYAYHSEVYFGPVSVVGVYPTQGWVYVEALDRIGGIRVNTSENLSVGDIVTVFGTVQYDSPADEMYIQAYSGWPATTGQTQVLDPLGMRNEWAKETSSARDIFSDGSFKYYSTGSLVQTWGKVEWTYPYGNNFTIHDGSKTYIENSGWTGAYVIVHLPPGGTMPALGDYVRVSGVITGTTQYSVNLRPRTQADIETITTWDTSSITGLQVGWNYLSVPGIPQNWNAENVFVGCTPGDGINLVGNLKRYLAPNQYWDWFGSCWNSSTGGILVGEGYGLNIPVGGNTCYSYPRTPVVGDQILSLPKGSESAPIWEMSFIGNPFDANVAWNACKVTDGNRLLSLPDAVSAGWIHKVQKQQGSGETLVDVNVSTENMEARKGYLVFPARDKLALIVPDPSL